MATTTELLKELAALLDRGLITREEFNIEKGKILGAPQDGEPSEGTGSPGSDDSQTESTGATVLTPAPGMVGGSGSKVGPNTGAEFLAGGNKGLPHAIGAYRILGVVGEGGMGRVFRARHRTEALAMRQGGDVALKVLHEQYARREKIAKRFEREAELGIRLDHPGIVRVIQLIMDRGQIALVMELVKGRQINEIYRPSSGPQSWASIKPLFIQLLDAVEHAHSLGVIHRDLKPDNVMITSDDQIKILDFGIAKDLDQGMTQTGLGMGTVDYMAPEQYTNAKLVGPSADLYALGVMLYQLLSGRLPWNPGDSKFTIMEAKKSGDFPPPTEFSAGIPAQVADAIRRSIDPDPDKRPSSAEEMRNLLISGDTAVPDGPVEQVTDEVSVSPSKTMIEESRPSPQQSYPPPPAPAPPRQTGGLSALLLSMFIVIGLCTLGAGGWYVWTEFVGELSQKADSDDDDDDRKKRSEDDDDRDRDEDDEGSTAKAVAVPTYKEVCTHYVDNFGVEDTASDRRWDDELDECMGDVRDIRQDIGQEAWEDFAYCYVETVTETDADRCVAEHITANSGSGDTGNYAYPEGGYTEPPTEPVVADDYEYIEYGADVFYSDYAKSVATPWNNNTRQWGNWRFNERSDTMEIYNIDSPDAVRVQFPKMSNGYLYVYTNEDQFTLYSGLWTDSTNYVSLGNVADTGHTPDARDWAYGEWLLAVRSGKMHLCHASNNWCLRFYSTSNGWVDINTPIDEWTIYPFGNSAELSEWSRGR